MRCLCLGTGMEWNRTPFKVKPKMKMHDVLLGCHLFIYLFNSLTYLKFDLLTGKFTKSSVD